MSLHVRLLYVPLTRSVGLPVPVTPNCGGVDEALADDQRWVSVPPRDLQQIATYIYYRKFVAIL